MAAMKRGREEARQSIMVMALREEAEEMEER
jgi:hypothetical protein